MALAAAPLATRLAAEGARWSGFVEVAGEEAYVKASPLRGGARLRWSARHHALREPLPREREFENLGWLRERLFLAPEPLFAAVAWRSGLACFQILATARVVDAVPLDDVLLGRAPGNRRVLLAELAREAGRMHALHFVHRDLFTRNVLVRAEPTGGALWFLDAWKGGERLQRRGPAYDLACLLLRANEELRAEEPAELLRDYAEARAGQGKPLRDVAAFVARVARERRRLAKRLHARPDEWRGRPPPQLEWPLPAPAARRP